MSTSSIFDEFDQAKAAVKAALERAEIAKRDFLQQADRLQTFPLQDIHFSKSSDRDFKPFQASQMARTELDVSIIHSSAERLLTECRTWLAELDKRNLIFARISPPDQDRLLKIHPELQTDTTLRRVSLA